MLARQSSRVAFDRLGLSGLLTESNSQHLLMLSLSKHTRTA